MWAAKEAKGLAVTQLEHRSILTNNVTLHVVQAGPESGPLVILLHGFPEFWYGWRHQFDFLAAAGYRVWAPDQRGYAQSEKPGGIAAYNVDQLAADVVGLIDAAGRERAILIGHDWGASVAWWTANKYPARLERLVILNVPHHSVMRRAMLQNRRQTLRSWYIFFFQLPWLPETLARAFSFAALTRLLTRTSRPGTFGPADLARYREAWAPRGALTAMINWYRAMMRRAAVMRLPSRRITVPTLMIWGTHDVALGRELAQPSIDLCDHGRLVFIEQAGHWVQHEEPERVNQLVGEFLTGA